MTANTVINIIIPIVAALIGGLATALFSRPKKAKKPIIILDIENVYAEISKIGLKFAEGENTNRIEIKSFKLNNISDQNIDDLTVEHKNFNKNPENFSISNNPSEGLLESYYDVSHSTERKSLTYLFHTFPSKCYFKSDVTINDFWTIGNFSAHSKTAEIITTKQFNMRELSAEKRVKSRFLIIYGTTVSAFLLMIIFLIIRVG